MAGTNDASMSMSMSMSMEERSVDTVTHAPTATTDTEPPMATGADAGAVPALATTAVSPQEPQLTTQTQSLASIQADSTASTSDDLDNAKEKEKKDGEEEEEREEDGERVVTLHDVLLEQSALNEAADAVLGDCSADHCSYPMGAFRQALYACLTCTPSSTPAASRAGVCLACSFHCHADHELVELYTKRAFRCDCGNARFAQAMTSTCSLCPDKAPDNARNTYSHNFAGLYCVCERPYPDPERVTPEIMVQCVVCEDWLHGEHLDGMGNGAGGAASSAATSCDELICAGCMAKHEFLRVYQLLEPQEDDDDEEEDDDDKEGQDTTKTKDCVLHKLQTRVAAMSEDERSDKAVEAARATSGPTFWRREWRQRLCSCGSCVARMEREKIAFLLDPEDSLQAYEARGSAAPAAAMPTATATATPAAVTVSASPAVATTTTTTAVAATADAEATGTATEAAAMSSLEVAAERAFQSSLSHEQQVEMARGYSHMKSKLQQYLSSFAASGTTVRAQDIHGFFDDLRQTKRPRLAKDQ